MGILLQNSISNEKEIRPEVRGNLWKVDFESSVS